MTAKRSGKTRPAPATRGGKGAHVAIVTARWNAEITSALARGAQAEAERSGATVDRYEVAGSFELPAAVALVADSGRYDAIVPLGCLVRGETPHFDVLANAIARSLSELSITYPIAIPFGILACETIEQARARAGGGEGNKGAEAMAAALELVALRQSLKSASPRRAARSSSRARSRSTQ
ncbi:MAG: 6,7-dimethyl-8-ribityllumazine synthase [Chloroflexi bacterium]|nr:6,7-dimethyl-8-ribityllumazine synthase [Chloroflexota bacterium]